MFSKCLTKLAKFDKRFTENLLIRTLFDAFKKVVPLVIINVYLRLAVKLIFDPSAIVPAIFRIHFRMPIFFQSILALVSAFDYLILALVAALWTKSYLEAKLDDLGFTKDELLPVLVNFALALFYGFSTYSNNSQGAMYLIFVLLLTYLSNLTYIYLTKWTKGKLDDFGFAYLFWGAAIMAVVSWIYSSIPSQVSQGSYNGFFSMGFFSHWFGLAITAFLTPVVFVLGFAIPTDLTTTATDLTQVNANLNEVYQSVMATLPYPQNPYSVLTTSAMIGGAGSTLALTVCLLFLKRRRLRRLGLWSLVPGVFDSNRILAYGLPLFFRPLMVVPMMLASTYGALMTSFFIKLHVLRPTVFTVPNGTPRLLLSFLASQTPYDALLITFLIMVGSILIFWPFIKALEKEEEHA
ncbi:PTS transporter subunit EIIC [Fructobacillus sp. CRL 2054]|uniref:PTS transporter subunit EIIC n=1 Tax=Fructobacillus sp. CRL 2054 TaxID=2763007 RepID=UPI0023780B29|nr:PTS transporter subunit EIIC [Fructobacillus sp. CRL 2054]MDD9138982.1 PTS transporter subunit EIIC [Fructobacillus sp. CRL 2054]